MTAPTDWRALDATALRRYIAERVGWTELEWIVDPDNIKILMGHPPDRPHPYTVIEVPPFEQHIDAALALFPADEGLSVEFEKIGDRWYVSLWKDLSSMEDMQRLAEFHDDHPAYGAAQCWCAWQESKEG